MTCAQREFADLLPMEAYESLFRHAPAALALAVPAEGGPVILQANDAFLRLLDRPRSRVEGRRIEAVFTALAGDQMLAAVERCLGDQAAFRIRIAIGKGTQLVRMLVDLRRVEDAAPPQVILSLTPLGEALGLAELGESGVIAEVGPLSRGLLYIHDVGNGLLRYGRHPLVNRLGLPRCPVALAVVRDLVHPDDAERWRQFAIERAAAEDDRVGKATFRMRGVDGDWLWINIRARAFTRDADGKVQRVIGVATDLTDEYNHAEALTQAATALARAEMQERRRIGRELHDSTAQLLAGARLSLTALERRLDPGSPARHALEDAREAVAGAQNEIRNFSYMLHPPPLQDQGLERAVRAFAAGFGRRTGLDISVTVSRGQWRIDFPMQVALFRVVQEALMNVVRHAGARKAWVRLRRQGPEISLEVEDDGIGLSSQSADEILAGVGVSGMKARMLQLGGDLQLLPGAKGLKVQARVTERSAPLD
ncbi:histidine kinase [Phenylobacterium sp. J367]|uniref:histidine kinase n=1 Tax=Phenylobacterium sp. J367 TaxID=2898435 RepID=UPI00215134A9|nr:histidine kinase [Phenylobacterium sp. J367]MCR5879804.1 histidine kinase [Phenylobacterium sp. J367]